MLKVPSPKRRDFSDGKECLVSSTMKTICRWYLAVLCMIQDDMKFRTALRSSNRFSIKHLMGDEYYVTLAKLDSFA